MINTAADFLTGFDVEPDNPLIIISMTALFERMYIQIYFTQATYKGSQQNAKCRVFKEQKRKKTFKEFVSAFLKQHILK